MQCISYDDISAIGQICLVLGLGRCHTEANLCCILPAQGSIPPLVALCCVSLSLSLTP